MKRKFLYSLVFSALLLTGFKVSVDLCLPYRHSAIFAQSLPYEHPVCRALFAWDSWSRDLVFRVSQGLSPFSSSVERDAVNPEKLSLGDFLLPWRVVQVLPLLAEEAPASPGATAKLCALVVGISLLLTVLWRFMEEMWIVILGVSEIGGDQIDPEDEIFKNLLSRNTTSDSRKLRW